MAIRFWLNDKLINTEEPSGRLLLDFIRSGPLKGTKEGCKEGDCGACTVLIGDLEAGKINYEAMTSCLVPLGQMHSKHVVTIEGLNLEKTLSPVQASMVYFGASQCGYCTPGFIVSMTWFLMSTKSPTLEGIKRAISGNLCRCTGYGSILRSGETLIDFLEKHREAVLESDNRMKALIDLNVLPQYLLEMPAHLAKIDTSYNEERTTLRGPAKRIYIAGGTDLYVQRGEEIPSLTPILLNEIPDLQGHRVEENKITIGAMTTFETFAAIPQIQKMIPNIDGFMQLIASLQIRNRATLGGNVVNASPIGDMTQILLALGTTITLTRQGQKRSMPLESFFIDYKKIELEDEEIVKEFTFLLNKNTTYFNFEKVSKRKELDIASVCSGGRFEVDARFQILDAKISMGGVAATPLLLRKTNAFLREKTISPSLLLDAADVLQSEISPISDIRGSKTYKRLLARQLFFAHFTELFPKQIQFQELAS